MEGKKSFITLTAFANFMLKDEGVRLVISKAIKHAISLLRLFNDRNLN